MRPFFQRPSKKWPYLGSPQSQPQRMYARYPPRLQGHLRCRHRAMPTGFPAEHPQRSKRMALAPRHGQLAQIGASQRRPIEVSPAKVCASKVGVVKIDLSQIGTLKRSLP